MALAPCVRDEGLSSRIPDSPVSIKSFVDTYFRLEGNLDILQTCFSLEPAQFHAAMAFYCANKELFDAEQARLDERRRKFWAEAAANEDAKRAWAEIRGALRGDETDEEIAAELERMS